MSEMVERVASAIREATGFPPEVCTNGYYTDLARAAILAMREITPEMLAAGHRFHGQAGAAHFHGAWIAAIDAALSEEKAEA
jgi:hypothetical protein